MGEKINNEKSDNFKMENIYSLRDYPSNLSNLIIENIDELMEGCFIELTVSFKPSYKINPPSWYDDGDVNDKEELENYYKNKEARIPTYPAYTVYRVNKIDKDRNVLFISKAPLFADSYELDESYFKYVISLPYGRIGRADFRGNGYFYGPTKTIGDYATEDLDSILTGMLQEYRDKYLRHKAMAQVDMIMADIERVFNVRNLPGQIFEISLVYKDKDFPAVVSSTIYSRLILRVIQKLVPTQVMVNMNVLYRLFRIQPDPNEDGEDQSLIIIAIDFTLKDDYHYSGVSSFDWPI